MNALSKLKVDKAEFHKFICQLAEGRCEYEEGRIVQPMTGGTFAHSRIVQRFVTALERQVDLETWVATRAVST